MIAKLQNVHLSTINTPGNILLSVSDIIPIDLHAHCSIVANRNDACSGKCGETENSAEIC